MSDTFDIFPLNELIFFLKNQEAGVLPGLKAHLELTPYRAIPAGVLPDPPADARKGAVAVIIQVHGPETAFILTKRVDYKGVHGGQISFPGGKQDPTDAGLFETATRETSEEIGLELDPDEFIRTLSPIYIPPSNFLVQPYLFILNRQAELKPNHEVDYVIHAGLNDLFADQSLQKTEIRLSDGFVLKEAPCFVYGKEIIWGATAAILNELKWVLRDYFKNRQVR